MFNGIFREELKTELNCRAYCLSRPYTECMAYDWDRVRFECFIHTKADPTGVNTDVDHYARQQCYETSSEYAYFQ